MEKMNRWRVYLPIKEQEQEYKQNLRSISHFKRRKGMFKSRPREFDKLVKLSKR